MKKLIAGNWKMNGTLDETRRLIADIVNGLHEEPSLMERCDFLVCPSSLHMAAVRHALHNIQTVAFGGQDCSPHDDGAHTGDISAAMLQDSLCKYVILGHSERRHQHGESSETVAEKAKKAHEHELITIICVGETEAEREQGQEKAVVEDQLKKSIPLFSTAHNTVIAYEPVWAIGTGKTATPDDVKAMHAFIREKLAERLEDSEKTRILYGGSMKPDNAAELLATENVDGGLIGGASLKAESFLGIARAA